MRPRHVLMAILVPAIWGMGIVVAKSAITHFSPIFLMSLRFALTSICLLLFLRPPFSQLKNFFWIALVSATVQYSFTYIGVSKVDASTAGLLVQLEVPFGLFLAWLAFGDRLSSKQAIGIIVAFLGAILIVGEPQLYGDLLYAFFVVIGAFAWAVGQIMIKKLQQYNGFIVISGVSMFAAPQLFITSLILENNQLQQVMTAPFEMWLLVVYLGVIMTAVGYGCWYYMLGRYDVNKVLPYLLLVPVASVFGGVMFLDETLTLRIFIGGVLSILGIAFITIQRAK